MAVTDDKFISLTETEVLPRAIPVSLHEIELAS
jgi:hypothetical protein